MRGRGKVRNVFGLSSCASFCFFSKLRSRLAHAAEYLSKGGERCGVWGSGRFTIALTRPSTSSVYVSHNTEGVTSTGITGRGLEYSSLGASCAGVAGPLSDTVHIETDDL